MPAIGIFMPMFIGIFIIGIFIVDIFMAAFMAVLVTLGEQEWGLMAFRYVTIPICHEDASACFLS